MPKRLFSLTLLALGLSLVAHDAVAQSGAPPGSLRGQLDSLGARISAAVGASPADIAAEVRTIADLGALEVSSAPLGTSTGAFTYTFDKSLGTFVRKTNSFGPSFAKRSMTQGKGRLSAGLNFLHADYGSAAGQDLTNGDFVTGKNFKNLPLPIALSETRLYASSDTVVGSASFGLTDNFDVGVAVPWVRMNVSVDINLLSASGIDLTPGGRAFLMPMASASGVGDIAIFGRYQLWHHNEGGISADVELRLPTGDTDNLRGLGVTRTLASAVWSQRVGMIGPHASVGYEAWSSKVPLSVTGDVFAKDQVNYAFGVELQPHLRSTVSLDIIGRHLFHGGQLSYQTVGFGPGSVDALLPVPGGISIISFAPGVKWNVAGNVLFSGSLLAALKNDGLRANLTPVVGLEWAF